MTSDLVKVVFRLYHLPDYVKTTLKEHGNAAHVCLLGSVPELGDWQLGNQLIAEPSPVEPGVWEVTVLLPVRLTFEVSWLVADGDKKILFWDPADDHRVRLFYHDSVVQVSWNQDPTYITSRTCTLVLETHYHCSDGHALAVVGSAPCLGSWNPERCVLAEEYPRGAGNWQAVTQVALDCEYEWKWAVVDVHSRSVTRWEERNNRYLHTNCHRLVIRAVWNLPSSIQSHSSKIYEQTIDMDKVVRFYDAVENAECLITKEMNHVTSTWKTRRQTSELPFVKTETDRSAAREQPSFIKMFPRYLKDVFSLFTENVVDYL